MLKSNFRFHLINRWRFLLCWSWPTNCFTLFCVLTVTFTMIFLLFALNWKMPESFLEVAFQGASIAQKITLNESNMECNSSFFDGRSCVEWKLNFCFFFQQKLDSKKENGRVTKVKEDKEKLFLSTSKQPPDKKT